MTLPSAEEVGVGAKFMVLTRFDRVWDVFPEGKVLAHFEDV